MYKIHFELGFSPDSDPEIVSAVIEALCQALTTANQYWIRGTIGVPLLYDSGVRYRREDRDEFFWDIPRVLKAGYADCEDLASWRAAELREIYDIPADPVVTWQYWRENNGEPYRIEYHVRVATPSGMEDPSIVLGM